MENSFEIFIVDGASVQSVVETNEGENPWKL
jgi:hypothetical protein